MVDGHDDVRLAPEAEDAMWVAHIAGAHALRKPRATSLPLIEKVIRYTAQADMLFVVAFLVSFVSTDAEQLVALTCIMVASLSIILREMLFMFQKDPLNAVEGPFHPRVPLGFLRTIAVISTSMFILELGARSAYISRWIAARWAVVRSPLVLPHSNSNKVSRMADSSELFPGRVGAVAYRFLFLVLAAVTIEQVVAPVLFGAGEATLVPTALGAGEMADVDTAAAAVAAGEAVVTDIVDAAAEGAGETEEVGAYAYAVELVGLTVAETVLFTLALYCDIRYMLYAPTSGVLVLPPAATWPLKYLRRAFGEHVIRELLSPDNEWIFRMGLGLKHPLLLLIVLCFLGVATTPVALAVVLTLLDKPEPPAETAGPDSCTHRFVTWLNTLKASPPLATVVGILDPAPSVEALLAEQNTIELNSMYDSRHVDPSRCVVDCAPAMEILKAKPLTPAHGRLPAMKTAAYRVLYNSLMASHLRPLEIDGGMLSYFIDETHRWVDAVHAAVRGTTPVPSIEKLVRCPGQSVPLLVLVLFQRHPKVRALRRDTALIEKLVDIIHCRGYSEPSPTSQRYEYPLGGIDVQQHVTLKCLALAAVLFDDWASNPALSRGFVSTSTHKVSYVMCAMFKTRPMHLTKMLSATSALFYKSIFSCLEPNSSFYAEELGAHPGAYSNINPQQSAPFYHVVLMMLVALDLGSVERLQLLVPILKCLEVFNKTAGAAILECAPGMLARQIQRVSVMVVNIAPRAVPGTARSGRAGQIVYDTACAVTHKCLGMLIALAQLSPVNVQFMTQNEGILTLLFSSLVDHPDAAIRTQAVELLEIIQSPDPQVPTPKTLDAISVARWRKAQAGGEGVGDGSNDDDLPSREWFSEDTCCVCLTDFEADEEIGRLPCGHIFHTACIKVWLYNKDRCPKCRAEVAPRGGPPASPGAARNASPPPPQQQQQQQQAEEVGTDATAAADAREAQKRAAAAAEARLAAEAEAAALRRAAADAAQKAEEDAAAAKRALEEAEAQQEAAKAAREQEAAAQAKAAEEAAATAAPSPPADEDQASASPPAAKAFKRKKRGVQAADGVAAPARPATTAAATREAVTVDDHLAVLRDDDTEEARRAAEKIEAARRAAEEEAAAAAKAEEEEAARAAAEEAARKAAEAEAARVAAEAAATEAARKAAEEEAAWKAAEEEMARRKAEEEAAAKAAEEEAARKAAAEAEAEAARRRAAAEEARRQAEAEEAARVAAEEAATRKAEADVAAQPVPTDEPSASPPAAKAFKRKKRGVQAADSASAPASRGAAPTREAVTVDDHLAVLRDDDTEEARRAAEKIEAARRAAEVEEAARVAAEAEAARVAAEAAAAEAARKAAEEEAAWKAAEEEMARRKAEEEAAAKAAAEEEMARRRAAEEEAAQKAAEEAAAARKAAEEEAARKAAEEEAAWKAAEEEMARRKAEEEAAAAAALEAAEEKMARRKAEGEEAARKAAEEEAARTAEEEAARRAAEEEETARQTAAEERQAAEAAPARTEEASPSTTEGGIKRKKRGMRSVA